MTLNLPPKIKSLLLNAMISRFTSRFAGNFVINQTLQTTAKDIAIFLGAKVAAQTASKGRLFAGSLGLGAAIGGIQILGIVDRIRDDEQELRTQWPEEWRHLHRFNKASYIYGVALDIFDSIFELKEKIRNNPKPEKIVAAL